ncbi:MAG TPA: RluA family pseudouridine synthase [Candidatus Ruthenibacterium merdigallinarum]|nr:RluA family pseudouridine synthase [Candidatus Ruthenibacterium merdigallinarum]
MEVIEFITRQDEAGERLDALIARRVPQLTRSRIQQLMEQGLVQAGGRPAAKSLRAVQDMPVRIEVPDAQPVPLKAQDIPLDVVYEDEALLVVNKPKGMVVHPAPGNPDGTLVNALLFHCRGALSGINGEMRPGIVHRIDKDTSGLLVVAKDDTAHLALSQQFSVHSITRVYQTVVYGGFREDDGAVEGLIGRSPADRKKMAVVTKNGKYAYTAYHVEQRFSGFTHLSVRLRTGRTHQIRVHMASIGHPVAGDAVYGPRKVIGALHGQCLHAGTLGFVHPRTGRYMQFDSPLPAYFTDFLAGLSKE